MAISIVATQKEGKYCACVIMEFPSLTVIRFDISAYTLCWGMYRVIKLDLTPSFLFLAISVFDINFHRLHCIVVGLKSFLEWNSPVLTLYNTKHFVVSQFPAKKLSSLQWVGLSEQIIESFFSSIEKVNMRLNRSTYTISYDCINFWHNFREKGSLFFFTIRQQTKDLLLLVPTHETPVATRNNFVILERSTWAIRFSHSFMLPSRIKTIVVEKSSKLVNLSCWGTPSELVDLNRWSCVVEID